MEKVTRYSNFFFKIECRDDLLVRISACQSEALFKCAPSPSAAPRLHKTKRISIYFGAALSTLSIYSTVTDFARLRGLSTSVPLAKAV
jgi:hypothetical protein